MSEADQDILYDNNELMLAEQGGMEEFEDDFDEEDDLLEDPEQGQDYYADDNVVEQDQPVRKVAKVITISSKIFQKMKEHVISAPGLGSLRRMIQIFMDVVKEGDGDVQRQKSYLIYDYDLLNSFIKFMVEEFPQSLISKAQIKEVNGEIVLGDPRYEVSIRSYIHTLSLLLENQNKAKMISYICINMSKSLNLLRLYQNQFLKIIRIVLEQWSHIDNINAKLRCLIFLKGACSVVPPKIYEKIMKKSYLYFCESTKAVTWASYDTISFMINGIAELCAVQPEISYTIIFGILRSLCTKISKLSADNNKQKMTKLYNYKVLNTFKFIAQTINRLKTDESFQQLIFPLIETIKGYSLVFPALQYFPLRIQLLRLLLKLKRDNGVQVPLLHLYSKLLKCKYFINKRSYSKAVETNFDPEISVRIPKDMVRSQPIWDVMLKELGDIMIQDLSMDADKLYSPETYFVFYKVISAYRKVAQDMQSKNVFKQIILLMRKQMNYVVFQRQFLKKSVKKIYQADPKDVEINLQHLKDNIREEAERIHSERNLLIQMKIKAEKETQDC